MNTKKSIIGDTKIFRFDDVCINANMQTINDVAELLLDRFPNCQIIYGVSPLVHDNCGERCFPKIINALSDYKEHYKVTKCGLPKLPDYVVLAGHGIVHCDHRRLSYEAQEMSILISCSLVNSKIFIPPFNKWNSNTELVCERNGIKLVKFENGWLSMEHNDYIEDQLLWYLHARDFNINAVKQWLLK